MGSGEMEGEELLVERRGPGVADPEGIPVGPEAAEQLLVEALQDPVEDPGHSSNPVARVGEGVDVAAQGLWACVRAPLSPVSGRKYTIEFDPINRTAKSDRRGGGDSRRGAR